MTSVSPKHFKRDIFGLLSSLKSGPTKGTNKILFFCMNQ